MKKNIVIAGGTGFLGSSLASFLKRKNYEVIVLTRNQNSIKEHIRYVNWTEEATWGHWVAKADVIINLIGKSVDCRYNEKNKKEILRSRIWATERIGDYLSRHENNNPLWINASTATIYNEATDTANTEDSKNIGSDFSMTVAKKWEEAFFKYQRANIRQVALRTSLVLGSSGGVLPVLIRNTNLGLGGHQGNGLQKFAWLHIDDFNHIISFIMQSKVSGVLNCTAPSDINNKQFNKALRKVLGIRFGISAPKWLLKIGCFILRTESELILKSRYVYPKKLMDLGYKFRYSNIKNALLSLTNS
jgi:uncharacterized protein (TIGR01777 family)